MAGIPLSAIAIIAAWIILAHFTGSIAIRLLTSLLSGIVVYSIVAMLCRVIAMSDYQDLLLPFYKELDPKTMLANLEAIDSKKLSEGERIMLSIHKANGYLYLGETERALSLLSYDSIKAKDLNNRYLVLAALSSIYLMKGDSEKVKELIDSLKAVVAMNRCPKDLAMRARRIISYLELCIAIRSGKKCDISVLEKDFASSKIPIHKLDVAYYIDMYLSLHKRSEGAQKYIGYIKTEGKKTVYPELLKSYN